MHTIDFCDHENVILVFSYFVIDFVMDYQVYDLQCYNFSILTSKQRRLSLKNDCTMNVCETLVFQCPYTKIVIPETMILL